MINNIMHTGKSGMSSTRNNIDLISNNIANSTTTGYKKLQSEFQTLLSSSLDKDSYPNNSKYVQTGTGVKTGEPMRVFTQGSFQQTGRYSDFAVEGEGYFRVVRPDGSYAYTRDGGFSIDSWGRIVDNYGNILDVSFKPGYSYENMKFNNNNSFGVSKEGEAVTDGISLNGEIKINGITVGNIDLYKPVGDTDMIAIRDNLLIPKQGVNMVQSNTTKIYQGFIEMSNTDLSEEMSNLIMAQRTYQLNAKGVTVADEMWALVNEM